MAQNREQMVQLLLGKGLLTRLSCEEDNRVFIYLYGNLLKQVFRYHAMGISTLLTFVREFSMIGVLT